MNLTLETSLHRIADTLRDRILPALDDGFAIEAARLATLLLTIGANAVDDAAALRVHENAQMREVFAEAGVIVSEPELAAQLRLAAESRDPGFRISELDVENGRLRVVLVALHAHVERQDGEGARLVDRRIWRMLEAFEKRRAPVA